MSDLLSMVDTQYVPVEAIYKVPVPASTPTWRPIGHGVIRDVILTVMGRRGLKIARERWALSVPSKTKKPGFGRTDPDIYKGPGARVFGLIEIVGEREDVKSAIGVRSSYDKTLPLGLAAGANVRVCDNLLFSGEHVRYRKHTRRIDVGAETARALDMVLRSGEDFGRFLDELCNAPVSNEQFDCIVCDSLRAGILPGTSATDMLRAWHDGKAPEDNSGFAQRLAEGVYADRNGWTAHGLWTDLVGKRHTLTASGNALIDSHKVLNDIFRAQLALN